MFNSKQMTSIQINDSDESKNKPLNQRVCIRYYFQSTHLLSLVLLVIMIVIISNMKSLDMSLRMSLKNLESIKLTISRDIQKIEPDKISTAVGDIEKHATSLRMSVIELDKARTAINNNMDYILEQAKSGTNLLRSEDGPMLIDDNDIFDIDKYGVVKSKSSPVFSFVIYKNGDIVSNHAKKYGAWEGGLSNVMLAILSLKAGSHQIVDFGTHIGWFSLLAASRGHKSIGIEAMKSNRDALINSIKMNKFHNLIELHDKGLGSSTGPKKLCIKSRAKNNFGNGVTTIADNSCEEEVHVSTLDKIARNRQIMFLKADCEGCEANALLGSKILLSQNPPCSMFIEWRTDNMRNLGTLDNDILEVFNLLSNVGYSFFKMRADLVTGKDLTVERLSDQAAKDICTKGGADLVLMLESKKCFQREDVDKFLKLVDDIRTNFNQSNIIYF